MCKNLAQLFLPLIMGKGDTEIVCRLIDVTLDLLTVVALHIYVKQIIIIMIDITFE